MSRQKRSRAGFTIAELLIAVSILVIIGVMIAVVFRSTQMSFTKAKAFQHVVDIARQAVIRMQTELQATYYDHEKTAFFVGLDALSGAGVKPQSGGDEVYFIAPEQGQGAVCELGFWQRNDGTLMRHYQDRPDFTIETATADYEMGVVIQDFDITYYDGMQFIDSWDSRVGGAQEGMIPSLVKIQFSISDTAHTYTKVFEVDARIAASGR